MTTLHKKYLLIIQFDWNAVVGDSHHNWSNIV